MTIKLIGFDLDGTTLQEDHEHFSDRLLQALAHAHEKGLILVPITGRPFFMRPPVLMEQHPWLNYMVCSNGADVRDVRTAEHIEQFLISPEKVEQIVNREQEDAYELELYDQDLVVLTQRVLELEQANPEQLRFHIEYVLKHKGKIVSEEEFANMLKQPQEKLNLITFSAQAQQAAMAKAKRLGLFGAAGSTSFTEVTYATKGLGLQALLNHLGIQKEETMVLGDSDNDVGMFEVAGYKVAMGNAIDLIKQMSDEITDTNVEDGAAKAIERLLTKMN